MKLKVVRGKNQFGYSFISDPTLLLESDTFAIRYRSRIVYTILRVSHNVPNDVTIMDYRLFDELRCNKHTELEILPIIDNIPQCGNITLSLESVIGLDNKKVADAISKRIEDLEPFLDGLIVREGQTIHIPDLKVKFIVTQLKPSAEFDRTARISWKNLLRININPKKHLQCHNVILLLDLNALSKSELLSNNQVDHKYTINEISNLMLSKLLEFLESCTGISLFASIAFSDHFSIFRTYNKTTGTQMDFNLIDESSLFKAHENWLTQQLDSSFNTLSDLGTALEQALELASAMNENNNLRTIIFLCSEGAYSLGPNPVKIARSNTTPEIGIFGVALGNEADVEFLNAIAKAGNGDIINIRSIDDIEQISEIFNHWITRGNRDGL